MEQHLIIVAGGIGSRIKSDRPKQFIELKGKPIIIRTLEAFMQYNPAMNTVICVHRSFGNHLEGLLEKFQISREHLRITFGGETRFESVRNGLRAIESDTGVVGIHDAARPLVSQQTIRTSYETAASKGNAIPCIAISESLRKISNNINVSVNRNEYKIVQTPQCFSLQRIRAAFEQAQGSSFTDDASVFEAHGNQIFLVEGNEENMKITSPLDLVLAASLLG